MVAESRFRRQSTKEPHSSESPGIHLGTGLPRGCKGGSVGVRLRRSCRQLSLRTADPATSATHRGVHQRHNGLPADCWEQLDSVDVKEVMLQRVPMLKSCSDFMKGRLRECFATALRERHREALIGDDEMQVRAWKLFALIPTMLFQRPRGSGSISRAELAQRIEGFFQGGQSSWSAATRAGNLCTTLVLSLARRPWSGSPDPTSPGRGARRSIHAIAVLFNSALCIDGCAGTAPHRRVHLRIPG